MSQLFTIPVPVRPVWKLTKWGVKKAVRRHRGGRRQAAGIPADQQAALVALAQLSKAGIDISGVQVKEPGQGIAWRAYVRCGGHRALRRPVIASIVLFLAWTAWHFIPPLGFWGFLARVVVLAGVMAAGAVWTGRVHEGVRRITVLVLVVMCGLWLVTPLGPAEFPFRWVMYGVVSAGVVVARGWHFRIRPRREGETRPVPRQADQARVWDELLGGERAPLAGTWLEEVRTADDGKSWSALVRSPRGSRGTESVSAARANIASAFAVNRSWVEIQETDDQSVSRIIVTTESTLSESRAWTPDGVTDTTVEVATRPDGSRVVVTIHEPGKGSKHFSFSGGTGCGKTTALAGFICRLMLPHQRTLRETGQEVGWIVLDLVDLGETSLPFLRDGGKAFRSGDSIASAHLALDRAIAVMGSRQAAMKDMTFVDRNGVERKGLSTLRVGPEYPIYVLLVEEAGSLVHDKKAMGKVAELARLGRKYGIMIIWVTQGTSIDEAWGSEQTRANVMTGGNAFCGATSNNAGHLLFNGSQKFDMSSIPRGMPGMGVWLTSGATVPVIARTDWLDEDDDRPAHVPSTWEAADMILPGVLEPAALAAVEAVEAEAEAVAAEDAEKAAARGATLDSSGGPVEATTREVVRAVFERLVDDNDGRPVKTSEIVAAYAAHIDLEAVPTSPEWTRVYDVVRKILPGIAVKTGRGEWAAA